MTPPSAPFALPVAQPFAEKSAAQKHEAAAEIVRTMVRRTYAGRIALVSSFGASAAVMLDLVAKADPETPVIFLDTGRHFGETKRYRDDLAAALGLTDVRSPAPLPAPLAGEDPDQMLFLGDPDRCCFLRKVEPLKRALAGFDAWFTGRWRVAGAARGSLPLFEIGDEGRVKVNPIADWTRAEVDAYFECSGLPRHPLEADGLRSIGCMPCTARVLPGEDERAGRWRAQDRIECGIHVPLG